MSSDEIVLPNEVIRLILQYCQTSKDYLSQSLINHRWYYEAQTLRSRMKTRFSRQLRLFNCRWLLWDFDLRVDVVGHGSHLERHGREECTQTFHRVGGPSCSVFYLERNWHEGKLHGLEIVREINEIWYEKYYAKSIESSSEPIEHPYEGLAAVDSMRHYGRHLLRPVNDKLPDNCDFLGRIVFKHQWTFGSLEDHRQLCQNLSQQDQPEFGSLYEFLHEIYLTSEKILNN